MGHHINEKGQFQSDKYPDLPPDKIILSFKDRASRWALLHFIDRTLDRELSKDVETRLKSIAKELNGDFQ